MGLSSSKRLWPVCWALRSTSCGGARHAWPEATTLAIGDGKPAAIHAHLSPRWRLAFLLRCLLLHRFTAGHHECAPCPSIANARSSGVMHGCNPWPRPVHSPASPFDCVLHAQKWDAVEYLQAELSGNGAQSVGLNELDKTCRRIRRRAVPVSCTFSGMGPEDGHLLCSPCSPPPLFSGRF